MTNDDVLARLRTATAPAHARLESALDLVRRAHDRAFIIKVLQRFHGFYAVWEPALLRQRECSGFYVPRQRLAALQADLIALGQPRELLETLPLNSAAERLARTVESAVGSMYVIEGSALGGQIIARAMESAPWITPEGLRIFRPYGGHAGAAWREFGDFARGIAATTAVEPILESAVETFDCLHNWLVPVDAA